MVESQLMLSTVKTNKEVWSKKEREKKKSVDNFRQNDQEGFLKEPV